jgi:hypothetical protein
MRALVGWEQVTRVMRLQTSLLIFAHRFALAQNGAAFANDSTASLDAGGLTLTFNPDISMESEDLYLSPGEVRVVYRFHNASSHDIATLVAFPLPVMTIGEQGNYDLEGRDPVDLMDFKVTAEGKSVEAKVEIRATRFGVDVTDVLKRYDIPPTMIASGEGARNALNDRLDDLPQDARNELTRYGVIDWNTTFGASPRRSPSPATPTSAGVSAACASKQHARVAAGDADRFQVIKRNPGTISNAVVIEDCGNVVISAIPATRLRLRGSQGRTARARRLLNREVASLCFAIVRRSSRRGGERCRWEPSRGFESHPLRSKLALHKGFLVISRFGLHFGLHGRHKAKGPGKGN